MSDLVKELVWQSSIDVCWSDTPIGRYRIMHNGAVGDLYVPTSETKNSIGDVDSLKAAAQSDYETRIRSALTPSATRVESAGEAVPVAWMRSVPPVSTVDGPGEWEVDFSYGDDEPVSAAGQSWSPLFAHPWDSGAKTVEAVRDIADDNDGKEQDAFEAWATSERYDMHQHPLHWLFMDKRTAAARNGWRAGIRYARDRALASPSQSGAKTVEAQRRAFLAGWMRYDTSRDVEYERAKQEFELWYGSAASPRPLSGEIEPVRQWCPIGTAPFACHFTACYFDHEVGEWVYDIIMRPVKGPYLWWMPLADPPPTSIPSSEPSRLTVGEK